MSDAPIVHTYAELRAAIAKRRRELGYSQLEFDDIAGFPQGYSGKLECGTRCFGEMSFEVTLKALGLEVVIKPRDGSETP